MYPAKDITGQRFGRLTAIRPIRHKTKHSNGLVWFCVCDCGKKISKRGTQLRNGQTTSCGCKGHGVARNLLGKRFGRLLVISLALKKRTRWGQRMWYCRCDCGNLKLADGSSLAAGHVKSCGCIRGVNLMGKKFAKLLVIGRVASIGFRHRWKCQCDCGHIVEVYGFSLMSGHTTSCGCYRTAGRIARYSMVLRPCDIPTDFAAIITLHNKFKKYLTTKRKTG